MKKFFIIAVGILSFLPTQSFSEMIHGKIAGTILKLDAPKMEITIRCADSKVPILLGSRLYIAADDRIILLDVTFPMMTTAKCRLSPQYAPSFSSLRSGMTVYFGSGPVSAGKNTAINRAREIRKISGVEMVALNGGSFMMGGSDSDPDAQINEKPLHRVEAGSFWVSKYEITQEQYQSIMGNNPSVFKGDPRLPVENISWYDAVEFCNALSAKAGLTPAYGINKQRKDPENMNSVDTVKWIVTVNQRAGGFRLPTEAEWEFACRAGTASPYFTGDSGDKDYFWYEKNSEDKTHPVGQKKQNSAGLYDVTGNVWEWCWDWYDDGYYRTGSEKEPRGPSSGSEKILRGGSWLNSKANMRSSLRNMTSPSDKSSNTGLRVVVSGSNR